MLPFACWSLCTSQHQPTMGFVHRSQAPRLLSSTDTGHGTRPCFPGLRRQADAGIRRAKALISPPLDDLEKEPLLESVGIDLEELAIAIAIVKNAVFLHRFQQRRIELVAAVAVVLIIFGECPER